MANALYKDSSLVCSILERSDALRIYDDDSIASDTLVTSRLREFTDVAEMQHKEADISSLQISCLQMVEFLRENKPTFTNSAPFDEVISMCCFFCREFDDLFMPCIEILYEFMDPPNIDVGNLLIENGLDVLIPKILEFCESDFRFDVLRACAEQSIECRNLILEVCPDMMTNLHEGVLCPTCTLVPQILDLLKSLMSYPIESEHELHLTSHIIYACLMKNDDEISDSALSVLQFTTENQPLAWEILRDKQLEEVLKEMVSRRTYITEVCRILLPVSSNVHPEFRQLMMDQILEGKVDDDTFNLCVVKLIKDSIDDEESIEELMENGVSFILKTVDEVGSCTARSLAAETARELIDKGSYKQRSVLIDDEIWMLLIEGVVCLNGAFIRTMITVLDHIRSIEAYDILDNLVQHFDEHDVISLRECDNEEAVELCELLDTLTVE